MLKNFIGILLITLLGSVNALAFAFPLPQQAMTVENLRSFRASGNLSAANFHAIIALSNCSGSLVRYENSQPSDKAMVMTNGHCIGAQRGFLKPGQVVVNKATSRGLGLLNNDGSKVATLNANVILFATMTNTDMTLYGLDKTYEELAKAYGVRPLVLSSKRAVESTPMAVVSGYWKKIYTCNVDKFIYKMKEADWTFRDSIRYSKPGCNTIGGTSGSPIINTNTYEVIGINNTGNENGGKCSMDNPCEIDEKGNVTVVKGASYGQQTYWVYSCLNANRQIDLNIKGCLLNPNVQ